MSVGNNRASIFAVKEEVTSGTLEKITSGTQFLPLRPGFSMAYKAEELTNDELQSDIGLAKSSKGKESVEGGHEAYLKHSGSEGVAPATGVLYKSILGAETVNTAEKSLIAGSTVSVLKVGVGQGVNFYKGQALLIKDSANQYSIRNVKEVVGDDIHLNFSVNVAPATGIALGKAVTYSPLSSGFKTFSAWLYQGNGFNVTAASGCTVTELSADFSANAFGSTAFKYVGTKYYMNPVEITATTKFIDWTDDAGTHAASIAPAWYRNPAQVATALQAAMNNASVNQVTVTFDNVAGKFVIKSVDSTLFTLKFSTGANTANTIALKVGFLVADKSAGTSYTSDNAQDYGAAMAPVFDVSDTIVLKDAEFMIGSLDEIICRCATKATMKIAKKTEDVDCICEETGTKEKIAVSREVTIEAELILDKHDVSLFNHLLNNETISAMLNAGPKSARNWIGGKCFNVYLPNAVVTSFSPSGDQFIIAKISVRGFIDTNYKDVFVNFI